MLKLFVTLILFTTSSAFSYANFIGYGYGSCLTCHYNAFGNGPLNDYGRALGATMVSGRLFTANATGEEKIAERSGFFFNTPKQTWFRPSIDYRGLYIPKNGTIDSRLIHMQTDLNVVLKFAEDKLWMSGTIGLAPAAPGPGVEAGEQTLYSREHYIAYALGEKHRLYLGKTDPLYGLRIPDHTVTAKRGIGLAENDQTYGLTYHWFSNKIEGGFQLFAGDVLVNETGNFLGVSSKHEYSLSEKARIGASAYYGTHDTATKLMAALHSKLGFRKGSSLISEFGMMIKTDALSSGATEDTRLIYAFLQNQISLFRGFNLLQTFDYGNRNVTNSDASVTTALPSSNWQVFLGFQFFPMQRVELRAEVGLLRRYGEDEGSSNKKDSKQILLQTHIWL